MSRVQKLKRGDLVVCIAEELDTSPKAGHVFIFESEFPDKKHISITRTKLGWCANYWYKKENFRLIERDNLLRLIIE